VPRKTKPTWLEKAFGRRTGKKIERSRSDDFRKLTPTELKAAGRSPKSEGYVLKATKRVTPRTLVVSKRQYRQKRLFEETGQRVTLERRAEQYLSGERVAKNARQESMRELSLEAWGLRNKYKGEKVSRIREHLRHVEIKKQGGQLDDEVWKREKAFAEDHLNVPEAAQAYRTFFNYGHVKRSPAVAGGQNATGRARSAAASSVGRARSKGRAA
jgi:hypothetical protein